MEPKNRKFIVPKRNRFTNNTTTRNFQNNGTTNITSSTSKSVKRSRELEESDSPPAKVRRGNSNNNDYLRNKSFPRSSTKNLANKRMQNLRKSLAEKREQGEKEINDRINQTSTDDLSQSPATSFMNSTPISDRINQTDTNYVPKSSTSFLKSASINDRLNRNNITDVSRSLTTSFMNSTPISDRINRTNINDVSRSSTTFRNSTPIKDTGSPYFIKKPLSSLDKFDTPIVKRNSLNSRLLAYKLKCNQNKIVGDNIENNEETTENSSKLNSSLTNICNTSVEDDNEMEWTTIDEISILNNINEIRKEIDYGKNVSCSELFDETPSITACNKVFIVVDTNIFLSQLDILMEIDGANFKDFGRATIIVPWMVIQELDYMKESKGCRLANNARKAVLYINKQLGQRNPYFKGQTVLEASNEDLSSKSADDGILYYCLQLVKENKYVILLSNDTNLRNKALVHKIQSYHSNDFINTLNNIKFENNDNNYKMSIEKIKMLFSNLLTYIIKTEMKNAYGEIWLLMLKSQPPYTVEEALSIINKYWVSVYSFSLQKQALQKVQDFISFLKQHRNVLEESWNQDMFNKYVEYILSLCIYFKNGYPRYKFFVMESITKIQDFAAT